MEGRVFLKKVREKLGLFVILLTTGACGIAPGTQDCTAAAPRGGILSYQGDFSPSASGITGIVRLYLVNGLITATVEALEIPAGTTRGFILETRDSGVFYQAEIRGSTCTQTFQTGKLLGATNRFSQATIHANSSSTSPLLATALLTSVLPGTTY